MGLSSHKICVSGLWSRSMAVPSLAPLPDPCSPVVPMSLSFKNLNTVEWIKNLDILENSESFLFDSFLKLEILLVFACWSLIFFKTYFRCIKENYYFPMQGVGFRCSEENECPFRVSSSAEFVRLKAKSLCFSKLKIHRNLLSNFTKIRMISSLSKITFFLQFGQYSHFVLRKRLLKSLKYSTFKLLNAYCSEEIAVPKKLPRLYLILNLNP